MNWESVDERLDNNDSGWISVTGTYANKIFYRKRGTLVNIRAEAGVQIPCSTSYTELFTLPIGFRPPVVIQSMQPASYSGTHIDVQIETSGKFKVAALSATNIWAINIFFYID